MIAQLKSPLVPEKTNLIKVTAKNVSLVVILSVASSLMIIIGLCMSINICISKKHQRMQQALAEELAFARINQQQQAQAQDEEDSSSEEESEASQRDRPQPTNVEQRVQNNS